LVKHETDLPTRFRYREYSVTEFPQARNAGGCALLADTRESMVVLDEQLFWQRLTGLK
jgi:hypothetical protein